MLDHDIETLVETLWDYLRLECSTGNHDFILGMGSYDTRVATHAAALYSAKVAPKIIFSGATGNWTKELFGRSEAAEFRQVALDQGVPDNAILIEDRATNTAENFRFSRELLQQLGLSANSVLLVCKPNMMRRAVATFMVEWPSIDVGIHSYPVSFRDQIEIQPFQQLVNEVVGDIDRLIRYGDLGFLIPQEIPVNVMEAYEALITSGFNDHLAVS